MATYTPPKYGEEYVTYISLISQADTDLFQTGVTLAAGDVTVFQDGALDGNIDALPTEIGATGVLTVTLSDAEMTADEIAVRFHDQAGDEWCDAIIVLHTTEAEIDDIAGEVWGYGTRTLTQTAVAIAAAVSGSTITIKRGDSLSASLTGLGDISGRTNLWFTVKDNLDDADTASIIQIDESTGLLYLNGAAAANPANGAITVDDAAAGDITITLQEAETDDLVPTQGLYYDVQVLDGGDVTTLTEGPCNVTGDVTRTIA